MALNQCLPKPEPLPGCFLWRSHTQTAFISVPELQPFSLRNRSCRFQPLNAELTCRASVFCKILVKTDEKEKKTCRPSVVDNKNHVACCHENTSPAIIRSAAHIHMQFRWCPFLCTTRYLLLNPITVVTSGLTGTKRRTCPGGGSVKQQL